VAEQWRGAARGAEDLVYVLAGLRTAASLVIGGQLHRGTGGAAGEIGLLSDARWGFAQDHLTRWSEGRSSAGAGDAARAAFDAARLGDASARAAVRRYSRDLAVGVAMLVLALDPELVVIGGGYSAAGDVLFDPLRSELEKRCPKVPQLVRSELGGEAPVYGAIRLALDAVEAEAFAQDVPAASVSYVDVERRSRAADR
jgi:predicted NBD/HSP70 family sugar kinase